ncbi:hypothetical protein CHS0354_002957, partial [Potamilus streckersoni]
INAGYMLYVCKEDSVKLFADTAFNPSEESSVTLYHNGTTVGLWTNNESKCFNTKCRDGNNDIWLNGFQESDNGIYSLLYQRHIHGPIEKQKERTFLVTIPPLPSCKPRFSYIPIDGVSGNLTAFLPETGCGYPPVTLFWFSVPNQKYNDFANLSQGPLIHLRVNSLENPGLYIVYIRGPAMKCLRDQPHTDYCYQFHVPEYKGDGRQLSAVQSKDRTNWIHWSFTIMILILIVVTTHSLVYLLLNFEKIKVGIQNTWRHCRHGEAISVGDMEGTNTLMSIKTSDSLSII